MCTSYLQKLFQPLHRTSIWCWASSRAWTWSFALLCRAWIDIQTVLMWPGGANKDSHFSVCLLMTKGPLVFQCIHNHPFLPFEESRMQQASRRTHLSSTNFWGKSLHTTWRAGVFLMKAQLYATRQAQVPIATLSQLGSHQPLRKEAHQPQHFKRKQPSQRREGAVLLVTQDVSRRPWCSWNHIQHSSCKAVLLGVGQSH